MIIWTSSRRLPELRLRKSKLMVRRSKPARSRWCKSTTVKE